MAPEITGHRETLKKLFHEKALSEGPEIQLASGENSSFYIDSKKLSLKASSLKLLGDYVMDVWEGLGVLPSHVAGVSVGGDPLAASVILSAFERGHDLDALLVRKEKKEHGGTRGRAVEGSPATDCERVFLLEDVVSTGGSSLKAARFLLDEGYPLKSLWALVDREMGGLEKLQTELGIPVSALFKASEIRTL